MTQAFESLYARELAALTILFGEERVARDLQRVKEIYEYTEAKWREYVALLRGRRVRYLLIAEAPPWSPDGLPQYLLDPDSRPRTLMRALRGALPGCQTLSSSDCLQAFARQGFLLLDSIPFAMEYSSSHRSSGRYDDLVRLTLTSFLQRKIAASGLTWSPDLRIAFSLRLNALAIMRAITYLSIGSRAHPLSANMIAVSSSNYPDAARLRQAYSLGGRGSGEAQD